MNQFTVDHVSTVRTFLVAVGEDRYRVIFSSYHLVECASLQSGRYMTEADYEVNKGLYAAITNIASDISGGFAE